MDTRKQVEETTNSVTPVKKSQVSAFSARQPVQHMPIHVGELQSKRMGKNSEFSISEVIEGTLRKAQRMTLIEEEMQGQMDGAIGAQGRENMTGAGLSCERSDVDAHHLSRNIQQPSTQYSSQLDPFTSLHAERDELGYSPILPGLLAHETPRTKALTDALLPIASPIELQLIEFVAEFDLSVSESETDKSETEKSKLDVGDVQLSVDNGDDSTASEVRCWRSPDLQLTHRRLRFSYCLASTVLCTVSHILALSLSLTLSLLLSLDPSHLSHPLSPYPSLSLPPSLLPVSVPFSLSLSLPPPPLAYTHTQVLPPVLSMIRHLEF
jgi:hypothetical protein